MVLDHSKRVSLNIFVDQLLSEYLYLQSAFASFVLFLTTAFVRSIIDGARGYYERASGGDPASGDTLARFRLLR